MPRSSFKICRDDYAGDEAAVTGESEISFECEEEVVPEEEVIPETEPETIPTTDVESIETVDNVPNPETTDVIAVYASLLAAFAFGLVFSVKNFIATQKINKQNTNPPNFEGGFLSEKQPTSPARYLLARLHICIIA